MNGEKRINEKTWCVTSFLSAAGLLMLLQGCVHQEQPTAPAVAPTYQWTQVLYDNFTSAPGTWELMLGDGFNGPSYYSPYGKWSWSDTSGGRLVLEDSMVTAKGHVSATSPLGGWWASEMIRISMDIRLSSVDSNTAGIMLVDSGYKRKYSLMLGKDSAGRINPGVLTMTWSAFTDSAITIYAEAHQAVPSFAANVFYRLEMTLNMSSMQMRGELLRADSSIVWIAMPLSVKVTSGLFPGMDLEGTVTSPVWIDNFAMTSYVVPQPAYGYTWRWSDFSALRLDDVSGNPVAAVGRVSGYPTQGGSPMSWPADSPIRVSMVTSLASASAGAVALTIQDNTSNRKYWLVIGNNGVGNAAAGVLSVIATEAVNSQVVINQARQAIQNLTANNGYQLILTLDDSAVVGELLSMTDGTSARVSIPDGAIFTGNYTVLFPGVDFVGTASSPVYAQSFGVERYVQVSNGGGGGGSCPFIYSYDGARHVLDAEPYGGAICKGLQRTEWCVLEHMKEARGVYELLMTNELDETQYTDELKLLVVDHPCSLSVAPDVSGAIHTFSRPSAPLWAVNRAGEDILGLCREKDGRRWTGSMDRFDPDGANEPRDTLTFRFAKPRNASRVKLLINAGTTAWGAAMARRFLTAYGGLLGRWYDAVDKGGTAHKRIMDWYGKEELYMLKLQVATHEGWKTRETIMGAGPVVAPDRVYVIDIHDVPGDTVAIRMAPPAGFWAIDWIASDYSGDAQVTIQEIAAVSALSRSGEDVRQALAGKDGRYHAAQKGDSVRMAFAVPPLPEGLGRTIVLKADGYYKMHLKAPLFPRFGLMAGMKKQGFSARYALKEYRRSEYRRK